MSRAKSYTQHKYIMKNRVFKRIAVICIDPENKLEHCKGLTLDTLERGEQGSYVLWT